MSPRAETSLSTAIIMYCITCPEGNVAASSFFFPNPVNGAGGAVLLRCPEEGRPAGRPRHVPCLSPLTAKHPPPQASHLTPLTRSPTLPAPAPRRLERPTEGADAAEPPVSTATGRRGQARPLSPRRRPQAAPRPAAGVRAARPPPGRGGASRGGVGRPGGASGR